MQELQEPGSQLLVVVCTFLPKTDFFLIPIVNKGNRTIADLRYGGKDIISRIPLICAPLKS